MAGGLAERLGLGAAELPRTPRAGRVAELGAALAVAAGAMGKFALDVVLLAQTEVGEVRPAPAGVLDAAAQAQPDRRRPRPRLRLRCRRSPAPLLGAMAQEHERAAGAWHASGSRSGGRSRLTGGRLPARARRSSG